jgi:hypothetical protein
MAGEGLIWAGIGQGIANAGSTMGQFLMRSQERETERDYRDKLEQERRDFRAEQNALYKRTAEDQNAGRAGGGAGKDLGIQPADLQPGGKYAGMAAGQLDTTEDRLADYQKYRKTGEIDLEKYGREVPNRGEENVIAGSKEVPQALKDEFKIKAKALSQLEESYALKGSYDDVMKGRDTGFKTGVGQGVLVGTTKMGTGSGAVAASEGKPIINVEGGEQYNQYSGESKTTPLGKSQIAENQAQAGQAGALAKKYGKDIEKIDAEITGGMFSKNSSEKLTSVINAANGTIKSLNEGGKGNTPEAKASWQKSMDDAVAVRDQAQALQKGALEAKVTSPAPKPETGAMPEPRSAADLAKIKSGTRYKAPDGSIRTKG